MTSFKRFKNYLLIVNPPDTKPAGLWTAAAAHFQIIIGLSQARLDFCAAEIYTVCA